MDKGHGHALSGCTEAFQAWTADGHQASSSGITRHHTNEGALTSTAGGFDEGLYRQQKSLSLLMDDWGCEGFKYKKEVIKRGGISLAEARKKAEWSELVNNNLQVCHQSGPVNIMHYQYSSWIPLNRITNRDEEMESQK